MPEAGNSLTSFGGFGDETSSAKPCHEASIAAEDQMVEPVEEAGAGVALHVVGQLPRRFVVRQEVIELLLNQG
jgi:hypothetical protein